VSKKIILGYIKFNLIFFLFHFLTWNVFLTLKLSYVFIFIFQYSIFSSTLLFLKKTAPHIVFVSFPLIILYLVSVISFLDRSLTVSMLLIYFENNFQPIPIQDLFNIDKLDNKYLLHKRIEEQTDSGLINVIKESIEVTPYGRIFSRLYKFMSTFYS
jgi:hypothetical protein